MRRRWFDARIWLPAIIAAACFALRALPEQPPPPASQPRSIALPQLYGAAIKGRSQRYELVADQSSVRFVVDGPRGQLCAECERVEGELWFDPSQDSGALTLHFDLASLRVLGETANGLDVRHVLGVLGDLEVVYRGRLVATTTSDLPGVEQLTFLGTIHFGSRVLAQPMRLWRCSLLGRPLRLQGHGTVTGGAFGLPGRTWLFVVDERHDVTLGLDLAWRRVRGG